MSGKIIKDVAFLFSGQARTLDSTIPYLKKNILSQINSYDIFCYSSEDSDSYKIKLLDPTVNVLVKQKLIEENTGNLIQKIKKGHKKNYFVAGPDNYVKNIVEQIYKIEQVNKIRLEYEKENNIEYKLIIRIRFDELFFDTLNLNDIIENIQEGEVHIPIDDNEKGNTWCNDQIAIGKTDVMTQYCQLFSYLSNNIDFLYSITKLTKYDKFRIYCICDPIYGIIDFLCKILFISKINTDRFKNYGKLFALLFIQDICNSEKTFYLERLMYFYHTLSTQIKLSPYNFKYFLLREKGKNKDIFFFK